MNRRPKTDTRLVIAGLTALLAISASNAAPETTTWQGVWGNLETAQEYEKDSIRLRRAAIVVGGGFACAAIAYAIWKIPAVNRSIRRLVGSRPENKQIPQKPTQHRIGLQQQRATAQRQNKLNQCVTQLQSPNQNYHECGFFALCNAYAIEQCVQSNRPVNSGTVQQQSRQIYNHSRQTNLPRGDLTSDQITHARNRLFSDMLTRANCALLGVRANGEVHGASSNASQVIDNLAADHIDRAHFITHINRNHWILISVVRQGNHRVFYYMDSNNNHSPNGDAHQAVAYLKQRLSAPKRG